MSLEQLHGNELAALVTYLEMRAPPSQPPPSSPLQLTRVAHPTASPYRELFRKVGAQWLWFSRLAMDDAKLEAIIGAPGVELYEVSAPEGVVGMLELDFRQPNECELAFVGLVPELAGQGHGRWPLTQASRLAWREGISRVHVHTCSLDHPGALRAYIRAGFTPYKRAIERFPDPRLLGILPMDCAPQVPVLGTLTSAPAPAS